jgi:hypothetical protein
MEMRHVEIRDFYFPRRTLILLVWKSRTSMEIIIVMSGQEADASRTHISTTHATERICGTLLVNILF